MRSWTLAVVVALTFGVSFKKKGQRPATTWIGIPEPRACFWNGDQGTCIAQSRHYTCIYDYDAAIVACAERDPLGRPDPRTPGPPRNPKK